MNKLEKRAILCLILTATLLVGLGIFIYKLIVDGDTWASYPANKHIYKDGKLTQGTVYDRKGTVILENTKTGIPNYMDNPTMRKANLHVTGDTNQNILTGANRAFASNLVGYNFVNGTYSTDGKGRKLYLTIDSSINETAYKALNGRDGTVGVFNYKTGEILCMVSTPSYDPKTSNGSDSKNGAYINRFTSSAIVPGSIMKVLTTHAAIDTVSTINSFEYKCTGSRQIGESKVDRVTCLKPHGKVDFKGALAVSCNCAYSVISEEVGAEELEKYVDMTGLSKSYSIDGIRTTPGSFEFPKSGVNLAWAGIGQYHDLMNPCAMMVYMGAIANGGETEVPKLILKETFSNDVSSNVSLSKGTGKLISSETVAELDSLLRNTVEYNGDSKFPNLAARGKTGTAEVGGKKNPNAWFAGYLKDDNNPYAIVVLVENGGFGGAVATSVANKVLQELVKK